MDGVLLITYVRQAREKNPGSEDAILQAVSQRLRPVLMTSLTAFLGLLPLAYGVGAGADMLRPLAIAVIGALFISLLLSLVATPVCYYVMVRFLHLEKQPVVDPASPAESERSYSC